MILIELQKWTNFKELIYSDGLREPGSWYSLFKGKLKINTNLYGVKKCWDKLQMGQNSFSSSGESITLTFSS